MPSSSTSERLKRRALVPFLYAVATRFATVRDFSYLVASSWIPGVWILARLGDLGVIEAVVHFGAGFLAFVSVYEIGYLTNDGWDAAKAAEARRRMAFDPDARFVAAFVAIRLGVWAGIGVLSGWIGEPVWLLAFAALIVVMAAHNLVGATALRPATFFQLACLRFTIPVIGGVPAGDVILVLLIAVLVYAYFRFLAYMDSKDLLRMPARRRPAFGVAQIALLSPLIGYTGFLAGEWLLVELLGYFVALYGLYALAGRAQ